MIYCNLGQKITVEANNKHAKSLGRKAGKFFGKLGHSKVPGIPSNLERHVYNLGMTHDTEKT